MSVARKRSFDLGELDRADRSKLLMGLVVPRPIGWIGTRGPGGGDNLAPFSFFNLVVTTPPVLLFCPGMSVRSKDTLHNVRDSGVFTVSVVTDATAEAMNLTSGDYTSEIDEFAVANLGKVEGGVVNAPMVAEAAANMECRVMDIREIGAGPAASVVFGEVLQVHVLDEVLDGTRIRFDRLGAVGRMAGPWYTHSSELFSMERPQT